MNNRAITYIQRNKILSKAGFLSYKDFLNSNSWKLMREQRKNDFKNGEKCCFCNSSEFILIHHTKYKKGNMGKNKFGGTLPVCPVCHFGIHEIEKQYNIDPFRSTQIFKILYYPNNKEFIWQSKEKSQELKKQKRQLNMRIIKISNLPETLHHSIHSFIGIWSNLSVDEFIEKYEKVKKKDSIMLNIYFENKNKVIKYLESLNE